MARALEISTAYARLTVQSGLLPPERVLEGTGLTEAELQQLEFIPWQPVARMYRNIAADADSPGWGPRMGTQFNITAHGPLGFAALSAPTLGEALDVMATLYPVRNNGIYSWSGLEQGRYNLWVKDLTGDPGYFRYMSEIIIKIVESLLSTILGHPVGKNVQISFAHPPPADAEAVIAGYDAAVEFDAEHYCLSVPAPWRALPSPLYDEAVYRANVIRCREVIARREQEDSARAAVTRRLENHFDRAAAPDAAPGPAPTLEQLADEMHLTPRTLIRRLQAEDCSYRELLESQRQERARELLRDARLTVAQVGEALGYREPANFGRAFRRWYGSSPAAWRRQS